MSNEVWFEKVKELAAGQGWAVENASAGRQRRVVFHRCVSKGFDYRFGLKVADGSLRCVGNSLHSFIDGFDVHEGALSLSGVCRRKVVGMLTRLWHAFRNAEEGDLHVPSSREVSVHMTVTLKVRVREGYPALTAEDLESVLCDMDYRFGPSEEHAESGVEFDGRSTEILEWEYSV